MFNKLIPDCDYFQANCYTYYNMIVLRIINCDIDPTYNAILWVKTNFIPTSIHKTLEFRVIENTEDYLIVENDNKTYHFEQYYKYDNSRDDLYIYEVNNYDSDLELELSEEDYDSEGYFYSRKFIY